MLDDPGVARKKIMRAITDTGSEVRADEQEKPGVTNLLRIFSALAGESVPDLERRYAGTGYGQFKKDLARAGKEMGIRRYIYASSASVYGAGVKDSLSEEDPCFPQTEYARSKLAVEHELRAPAVLE